MSTLFLRKNNIINHRLCQEQTQQVNDAKFTTDCFQLKEVRRPCKPSGQSAAADHVL